MKRETICLIIACLISFILTAGIMNWRMEIVHAELSDTQQSLAKEVFRFHVIAESDSANDQKIKLKVRDAVLKYMKAHMTRAERRDAKATKAWTLTHKKELTDTADKILKKEKVSIIELAPMTNLARLIQKDKEAFSCIEEIAFRRGFIDKEQLKKLGSRLRKTPYGQYILSLCKEPGEMRKQK